MGQAAIDVNFIMTGIKSELPGLASQWKGPSIRLYLESETNRKCSLHL
jgi:hypothetical protein